jgi:hypothetical protein
MPCGRSRLGEPVTGSFDRWDVAADVHDPVQTERRSARTRSDRAQFERASSLQCRTRRRRAMGTAVFQSRAQVPLPEAGRQAAVAISLAGRCSGVAKDFDRLPEPEGN